MSLCFTYAINGVELHDPSNGFELKDGTEYAPALSPRTVTIEIPGMHGALPFWEDPLSSITVALTVRVLGATDDVLRTRWNTLISLLGNGTNQPIELTRTRGTEVDYAEAKLVSTTAPEFNVVGWIQTTIVLMIASGRWGSEFVEDPLTIPGSDQESQIALASSMPVSDMLVRVQGPLSTVTITDNVSGTGISWGGAVVVPMSNYLIIDMSTMNAYIRNDSAWTAAGTNVSATLVFTGNGPLTLTSQTTSTGKESSVTVTASGHSGSTALTIRARPVTA